MAIKEYHISSIKELRNLAVVCLPYVKSFKKIAFEGEIGAGKTTFIKILCQLLGVKETTSSPTFSIINEYHFDTGIIHHIDLYRLKNEAEAFDIGIAELLEQPHYCFIEWPDIATAYLPDRLLWINIQVMENQDRIFKIAF
jgi:tRNA threonylcarbamoyladenosine biosynthesis protein TsaE